MALRVLLADESSTIKKVIQLALQDFDVDVKAVAVGMDVLPVARAFEPHIIFADVLLAKKSGYEVCAEIKADPELKKIPCVLMWSGFMELDQAKAKASKAEQRIEKPFDPETLRGIVKALVPETNDNAIANFLSFPNMPDFVESQPTAKAPTKPAAAASNTLKLDTNDEPDDFQQVPLPKAKPVGPKPTAKPAASSQLEKPRQKPADADTWSHQDLSRFKLNLPTEDITPDYDDSVLTNAHIAMSDGMDEISLEDIDRQPTRPATTQKPTAPAAAKNLTAAPLDVHQMEEIVRAQVKEVLQDIAWKILPDVAERIVREEIQKLLKESERLS